MPYFLRLMRKEDITQVTEIDHEAFPTQWPPPDYQHELKNRLAHYIVACDQEKTIAEPGMKATPEKGRTGPASRLRRWFSRNRSYRNETSPPGREYILGFTGFWVMADEAHISVIAVRETYRRQGIGEQLLISLIDMAAELKTCTITLEVRTSNTVAQSLYAKYGFRSVGIRRGYYIDKGVDIDRREDALLMSTQDITSAPFQTHLQQLKQAHTKKWGTPDFHIAGQPPANSNHPVPPGNQ